MIIFFILLVIINILFNLNNLMGSIYNSLFIWFLNVYPSIFIFYTISCYFIKSPVIYKFSNLLKIIIRFDSNYSYALLLINVFLGNPGTCKLINNSYENNQISEYDYNLLNKVTIFMNPLFVLSFLQFKHYLIYLISILIYIKLYSIFHKHKNHNAIYESKKATKYMFEDFSKSINDVIYILLNVACLITFFNIVKNTFVFAISFINKDILFFDIIFSFLEVSSGLHDIRNLDNIYLTILLISFQGICILMQSYFILNKKNISFIRYIFNKLFSSIVVTFIFFIITILFHI